MMNDYDYFRIDEIRPIDVNHMNVSKYDWQHEKGGNGENFSKGKHKKFSEVKGEIVPKGKEIVRKERSLEEHMNYMIWIGQKNCKIMNM